MKNGFYWIRVRGIDEWIVAQWHRRTWIGVYSQSAVIDIGPRIPTPDEPWQCVPKEPTEAMIDSGVLALDGCFVSGIYKDMLSASPNP